MTRENVIVSFDDDSYFFQTAQIHDNHFYGVNGNFSKYYDFDSMEEEGNVIKLHKCKSYYKNNGIEAKDIIKNALTFIDADSYDSFILGNIFKYLLRYKFKGQKKEDLDKAKEYLSWLE